MLRPTQYPLGIVFVAMLSLIGCSGSGGSAGAPGAQGPAGSANVIYSAWKTTPATASVNYTYDGSLLKTYFLLAPEVTQPVLDSGFVMVYLRFGNNVNALPYTSFAGGLQNTMSFKPAIETTEPVAYSNATGPVAAGAAIPTAQQNRIRIFRFTADNSASVSLPVSLEYRYIIIPGGVAAAPVAPSVNGEKPVAPKDLDWSDYEAVKKYYNLPD
jgi:hypothetical protein